MKFSGLFKPANQRLVIILLALLSVSLTGPAQAQGVVSDEDKALLDSIDYDQKLDEQLPLDLAFTDDTGRPVQLGDYFGDKPVILVMAYYECPMLCTLVLNGLLDGLEAIDFDIGHQFEVVTISMDPGETPQMAAAKKETYTTFYARPGVEAGWHFLTGSAESIKGVTDAIGFRYVYDERIDQYAHATGIVLLTPEGRISRYFYGIEFDPTGVRLGLVEASNNQIGSPIDQVLLMCYHYDPQSGEYTPLVMNIVRLAGTAMMLLVGVPILVTVVRNQRGKSAPVG